MLAPRSIAALEARATRYAVPDSKVAGLELRVHPDGSKRWSLRYRVNGEQRRLKLGAYPRLSLSDARQLANKELRKLGAQPVDQPLSRSYLRNPIYERR